MNPEIELDLIRRSIHGGQQAFRQLVEFHQGFAYSIAYRFTRDENESEDIVQEAFVKCWKNLSQFNSQYRFKTWLSKIVTNLCLDYLKSGRKKKMIRENHVSKENEPITHPENLEQEELRLIIFRLAGQLTEKQKAVFILRDLEMMTTEEVCDSLQMSAGNMKSNLYYARLRIKEGLQKFYKV